MGKHSVIFWIGVGLLVVNTLVGWGGAAVCSFLALKTKRRRFYCLLGSIIYGISWLMLVVGGFMAGSEGYVLVKDIFLKAIQHLKIF